jgi:hypothetical protein
LNRIMQSSETKPTMGGSSSQTKWDKLLSERQATTGGSSPTVTKSRGYFSTLGHVQDQTMPVTISNRPRLSSSLSRQSSVATMDNFNTTMDISHVNSTAWKSMFQQDHQEIPYSPAHIFEEKTNIITTVHLPTTGSAIRATTVPLPASLPSSMHEVGNVSMPMTHSTTSPTATTTHTAGAHTLLLAAHVLHEETKHKKNHSAEVNATNQKSHTTTKTATNTNTSTLKLNKGSVQRTVTGSKIRAGNFKKRILTSSENDSQNDKNVPAGHAIVEDGRIALLIPDVEITNNDVLLGRGGRTNHHIGNGTYRAFKESLQEKYLHATKDEKTCISNQLVQMIHEKHGRFLKAYEPMKNATGIVEFWYEVDLLTARKKASQALREINTPEMRAAKRAKYSASSKGK